MSGRAAKPEVDRAERILLERAVTEQWDFSAEYRRGVVQSLVRDVLNPQLSPRDRARAAAVLQKMQAQNHAAAIKALDKTMPDLVSLSSGEGAVEAFRAMLAEASDGAEARERARRLVSEVLAADAGEGGKPAHAAADPGAGAPAAD